MADALQPLLLVSKGLTTRRLVVAVLFVGLFAMATRAAVDSDIWWHLAAGRWMFEHGGFLTQDEFTHTFHGAEYRYPAWVSELVMFLLFRYLGYGGLSLFVSVFVVVAFGFVYQTCEGGPYLRAFCLVLAATASAVYWAARPHILSLALSAAYAYYLHLWRWRGVNRLWALPLLMVAWVNLHPGFALGFIVIALTLVGQTISAAFAIRHSQFAIPGATGWRGVRQLVLVGLACAGAVSVNPVGPKLLAYPFQTVSIGVLQDFIQEWQSPDFHFRDQQVFIWLLLAVLAAAGFSRRRMDVTDFVLVGGSAYLALVAARNIALFALLAAPVLTRHLDAGLAELRAKYPRLPMPGDGPPTPRAVALNWVLLAVVAAAALVKISLPLQADLNERERARFLPVAAAMFIAQSKPAGPMFNSYNWGGYLAWELYPDYLVYVDGRTDLYGNDFLSEYLQVSLGREVWREVFARRGIRLVVVERDSLLADALRREPDWRLTYADSLAAVFEKN